MSNRGNNHQLKEKLNITFGVGLFHAHYGSFKEALKDCLYLEELGYDSIWLGDHFYNPIHPKEPWFETWALLAALATQTDKIRLGTLVTTFIYRNPALVAKQALTVDHISEGRLELGLGAGVYKEDHSMSGTDYWKAQERILRFKEALQIVDSLLRNEITTIKGHFYWVQDAVCNPAPIQSPRPPITIAALGNKMMKIVAEYADSWNTFGWNTRNLQTNTPPTAKEAFEDIKKKNEILNTHCKTLGRNPLTIKRSLLVGWTPDAPVDSLDSFYDFIVKYHSIGITEFIFDWLKEEHREKYEKSLITKCLGTDTLKDFAQKVIPKFSE
ncbi:MAG: LLM class flavin-dependent oxidoreductase [Candidatus Hodarchaeota archaeon]